LRVAQLWTTHVESRRLGPWLFDARTRTIAVHVFGAAAEVRRAGGVERIRSSVLPDLRASAFGLFSET